MPGRMEQGPATQLCLDCRRLSWLCRQLSEDLALLRRRRSLATPEARRALQAQHADAQARLESATRQLYTLSEQLTDPRQPRLLVYRYLDRLPWQEIAHRLELELRHTMNLHQQALHSLNRATRPQ